MKNALVTGGAGFIGSQGIVEPSKAGYRSATLNNLTAFGREFGRSARKTLEDTTRIAWRRTQKGLR